eukprot:COSAG01_NODE_4718_length_4794_cov_363.209585_3_plen_50_part_00
MKMQTLHDGIQSWRSATLCCELVLGMESNTSCALKKIVPNGVRACLMTK